MSSHTEDLDERDELDVLLILRRLWARRWWIVMCTLLGAGSFGVAAFLMKPIYRAAAVSIPVATDDSGMGAISSALGQLGGLASMAGISVGGGSSKLEESLAVLRSRQFSESFIQDENLMPSLFPEKWDARSMAWRPNVEVPTLAQGFRRFDKKVRTVTHDKKTSLVTLAIEWPDPDRAADMANELVKRLNAEMRDREKERTAAYLKYLEAELETTRAIDTRAAISRLIEAQVNQRMYANVTEEYALRVVDRALPPDARDVVRPRKMMMIAFGALLGFAVASTVSLLSYLPGLHGPLRHS